MIRAILSAAMLSLAVSFVAAQTSPSTWLDRPLANWNKAGAPVPAAPGAGNTESREAIITRCKLTPPRSTAAERAVDAAGWIPFWNFDQQLVREDLEIVGGMRNADGMCRPSTYNLFVFVGGRFAGLLSPAHMTSREDGSSGVVRIALPAITAEFARYTARDALCCPSSHVRVSYRIDRTNAGPLVTPTDIRARP